MPETYRIQVSPAAADDLNSIFEYISRESSGRAQSVIQNLLSAVDSLATMPQRCALVQGSEQLGVRSLVARPFLIRFRIDTSNKVVRIVQVRHGAKNT